MIYIKLKIAQVEKQSKLHPFKKVASFLLRKIVPVANPDFEDKFRKVSCWLLEFEDEKSPPTRELGLSIDNTVIMKMPYNDNYGYWTDNTLSVSDFKKQFVVEKITEQFFVEKWLSFT